MDQGNKNKKLLDSYMYQFLENTDFFLASMIHNEPVRNAIAAARLGPLEQGLFNHTSRIWTNATQPFLYELHRFVKDNFPFST